MFFHCCLLLCKLIELTNACVDDGKTTLVEGPVILRWNSSPRNDNSAVLPLPPKELEKLTEFNCRGGEEEETEEWSDE